MSIRHTRPPFVAGAGVPPPKFAGRLHILEQFDEDLSALEQGHYANPHAVIGSRGMGKTALLGELSIVARERGWKTALFEVQRRRSFEQQLVDSINVIVGELAPGRTALRDLRAALASTTSLSLSTSALAPVQIEWTVSGPAEPEQLGNDITQLITAVGELARKKSSGCVIFIDEFHEAKPTELTSLLAALQSLATQREHAPFQVIGAGLPSLLKRLMEAATYGERLIDLWDLEPLTRAETTDALRAPALSRGRDFTDEAIERIYLETEGYPYFVQRWGQEVWRRAAADEMGVSDVKSAHDSVIEDLDRRFYRMRTSRLSPRELEYVEAMAQFAPGERETPAIAAKLGATSAELSVIRERLINKGVIDSPRRGFVEFTAPGYDKYLQRQATRQSDFGRSR